MMSEEKLMPCPFCGGTAELTRQSRIGDWHAFCETCSAATSEEATLQEAAAAWNTRPAREEVSGEEVERVAWAILRAAKEDDAVRELQEYGNAGPFARAAIAAMNPKPAEPASGVGGPGIMVPRHATDAMMQAGLYHMPDGVEWADLFTAWHAMFDCIAEDGGMTTSLPATPATEKAVEPVAGVDELANVMIDAWKLADPKSGVAQYPASYIATFADMARAVRTKYPSAADVAAMREALPVMKSAFRTTTSGDGYVMTFKFPDLATLHAAEDEWHAFRKATAGGANAVEG